MNAKEIAEFFLKEMNGVINDNASTRTFAELVANKTLKELEKKLKEYEKPDEAMVDVVKLDTVLGEILKMRTTVRG